MNAADREPANEIVAYLRRNPWSLCAHVATALEHHPAYTSALLRALRDEGRVKSRGNTRGTLWAIANATAPEDVDDSAIVRELRSKAWQTCAELAGSLGCKTSWLTRRLQVLRAAGRLQSAGKARGTVWACA